MTKRKEPNDRSVWKHSRLEHIICLHLLALSLHTPPFSAGLSEAFSSNNRLLSYRLIFCQVTSPRLTNGPLTCRSCPPSAADTGGRLRWRLWLGRRPI